jgi:uncharacterized paraquat-inducible protein A
VNDAPGRRCDFCGADLAERQRWCLRCGGASLTRVAATPRWRPTAMISALLGLLAMAGVGYAVATLASS